MIGRPDYDAGDLVVCVENAPFVSGKFAPGVVYVVKEVRPSRTRPGFYSALIVGIPPNPGAYGWKAEHFRRLDPKPPENFAGEIETVREDELA